ncbi:MAG: hypothetical protein PHC61_07070 [Chitinivibrionales bacterium]|nr:hypothetical protein [Chitinivibrionales bacterium]
MHPLSALIVFDIAVCLMMGVLASLSERLGGPLKIGPWYRLLYFACGLVCLALVIDTMVISGSAAHARLHVFTLGLRCVAGVLAVLTSLRYWKWLFAEI